MWLEAIKETFLVLMEQSGAWEWSERRLQAPSLSQGWFVDQEVERPMDVGIRYLETAQNSDCIPP